MRIGKRMDGLEGAVVVGGSYPGDSSKEDRMRETRRKGKKRTLPFLPFFFPSTRPVWQQLRSACCCCFSAEWLFEPWTTPPLRPYLHISPHPSLPPCLLLLHFDSIKLIYIIRTNSLITSSLAHNLRVSLNSVPPLPPKKEEEMMEVRKKWGRQMD